MTLSLAYDLPIKKEGDPYVALAEEAINSLALAVIPGKFLVDLIPILKYVPSWMPGAGFKRKQRSGTSYRNDSEMSHTTSLSGKW